MTMLKYYITQPATCVNISHGPPLDRMGPEHGVSMPVARVWREQGEWRLTRFPVKAALIPRGNQGFSAVSISIPGASVRGATEGEALEKLGLAIADLVRGCIDRGDPIPGGKRLVDVVDLTDIRAAQEREVVVQL